MGIGATRRSVAGALIRTQRQVVASLELVGEADLHEGTRVGRTQRSQSEESAPSGRRRVRHQVSARQLEPTSGDLRLGPRGRLEAPNRLIEIAMDHGAPPYPHVSGCAGDHQGEQEQREPLTCPPRPETIGPMDRSTLARILEEADGITGKESVFEASSGHQLSFYLGQPGQALVLTEILKVHLHQGYVQLDRKPTEGSVFLDYEAVHGLALRPPDEVRGRRPGF